VRSAGFCYLALLADVVGVRALSASDDTVGLFAAADIMMLVVVVAFAWTIRRGILGLFRIPRMDAVAWALLLLGPAGLWLLNRWLVSTTRYLPGVLLSDPILELRLAGASTWTVFLLVCVTPPVIEEIAFRGVILEQLGKPFGRWPAAVVVSVLFSVLHLAMLSFIPFAALALVLAALRLRTRSLWPAIVGHAMFNFATMFFDVGVRMIRPA